MSQEEFLAADQAEKCKDSQKVMGKVTFVHLAEKSTESQSVEMRSSKFLVGNCVVSLFSLSCGVLQRFHEQSTALLLLATQLSVSRHGIREDKKEANE